MITYNKYSESSNTYTYGPNLSSLGIQELLIIITELRDRNRFVYVYLRPARIKSGMYELIRMIRIQNIISTV